MATTQGTRAAATVQQRADVGPFVIVDSVTTSITANVTANDIIESIKVPRGARILEVIAAATDMDTGGSPTMSFQVGDGGSASRFIGTSVIPTTAGIVRMDQFGGVNYQYTADDTIDIKWIAVAATFAAGTISLIVMYRMDVI